MYLGDYYWQKASADDRQDEEGSPRHTQCVHDRPNGQQTHPSLSIYLCMLAGSCQYHGWRSKVRLSDYMRCFVCLDLSGHTTSPCVLSLCKTLFAFFGMLLVVVGYHLVLDGPHVLRCVLSNIRCFMQCVCYRSCAFR